MGDFIQTRKDERTKVGRNRLRPEPSGGFDISGVEPSGELIHSKVA
jgi:hypothetical protein